MGFYGKREKGFTLIELLVVIAIIALLLAIIVPALNLAKKKASSVVCMSNTRQMSMAWYMYQDENDGEIMSAQMENVGTDKSCTYGWIGQPHTQSDTTTSSLTMAQTNPPVTDEDEIRGAEKGKLFEYLDNPDVYHCPGDKLRLGPDGTKLFVSYAIAGCLNAFPTANSDLQIKKFHQISSPSRRYTFVESGERNRGNWIMGGWFPIAAPEFGHADYGLWAPVAITHGNSNSFGFADGHAEVHKWHSEIIFDHYNATENTPPGSGYGTRIPTSPNEDIDWLANGWAFRYKR